MTRELLFNLINITFNVLYFLILIRVLMSWLPQMAGNPIGKFVHEVTEPILAPLKKILPKTGLIDLSPIVAFLLLRFLESILLNLTK